MRINVLGTAYDVSFSCEHDDPRLSGIDGYCDATTKQCVVDSLNGVIQNAKGNLPEYKKQVLRHELIHAFFFESGLEGCCAWANDESAVDWIAIQFPKLMEAFKAADAL